MGKAVSKATEMEIRTIPVGELNPAEYNPRKDLKPTDIEYQKLKKDILEFGLIDPLVWNEATGNLVGGHQRLKVLKDLGYTDVQAVVVNIPNRAKEMIANLALNKIQGAWDMPKLKDVLEELDTGELDLDLSGFDLQEREMLMTQIHPSILDTDGEGGRWRGQASGDVTLASVGAFIGVISHDLEKELVDLLKGKWGDDPKVTIEAFCLWAVAVLGDSPLSEGDPT